MGDVELNSTNIEIEMEIDSAYCIETMRMPAPEVIGAMFEYLENTVYLVWFSRWHMLYPESHMRVPSFLP